MPHSLDFLYNVRWQDFIDIAVLSIVIYRILLMLRGTKTNQILSGLLIVAVFYYVADMIDLLGSAFVLTKVFNSVVIVLIVLFQSDIKLALAQMGTKTILFNGKLGKSADVLDDIYSVCEHFSKSGIGALIVLENEMGLGQYYSSATRLNAEFSRQLLVSLFNPYSPLHDGAVIIGRDNLIAYAGCILPLSKEIDFSKNQGTRHRAALGLSEETDAAVLVVSEETGEISMAWNGELLYQNEIFTLESKLKEIFLKKKKT
ncbi:MAG: TIGR00159 family protein [Proteobacteria bacterium]|nr:TIGR00159 family protein [Pseudomonadota bacterium]